MERRNFRTFVSGAAEISIIDPESLTDVPSLINDFSGVTSGNTEIDNLLYTLAGMFQTLEYRIEEINRRLNPGGSRQMPWLCETLDISGSGVKIRSDISLSTGDIVLFRTRLFDFPSPIFQAFGRVVRTESQPSTSGVSFYAGVEFLNLEPEQQEKLISYTFKQQRKYIRAFNKISGDESPWPAGADVKKVSAETAFSGRV